MIRIHRQQEPAELRVIRKAELKRVRPIAALRPLKRKNDEDADDLGTKYVFVKEKLWTRQHCKCCYCERTQIPESNDVEHYRPAISARRSEGEEPEDGYWWLAWSWSNLMFACQNCNRWAKNDWFPLQAGSRRLVEEEQPGRNSHEQPLLIDPASEDPMRHIKFQRDALTQKWLPFPRDGSERGRKTIEILKLAKRAAFVELYQKHVREHVMPAIDGVRAAAVRGVAAEVREIWNRHVLSLIKVNREFAALSFDVIEATVEARFRKQWGLHFRRSLMKTETAES